MSDRLLPCPACARHVRSSEGTCPFCAAGLPVARAAQPVPRSTGARLSRAALFALGASAAAAAACGGKADDSTFDSGVADGGAQEGPGVPIYGAPPSDAGILDAPGDAASDAATDADASEGDGAADAEGGTPAPLYGAPPP